MRTRFLQIAADDETILATLAMPLDDACLQISDASILLAIDHETDAGQVINDSVFKVTPGPGPRRIVNCNDGSDAPAFAHLTLTEVAFRRP